MHCRRTTCDLNTQKKVVRAYLFIYLFIYSCAYQNQSIHEDFERVVLLNDSIQSKKSLSFWKMFFRKRETFSSARAKSENVLERIGANDRAVSGIVPRGSEGFQTRG